MNIISLFCLIYPLITITYGKSARKSNVIAVFSEDDLSGKLPKPEIVAAEIPKNLILPKLNKLNSAGAADIPSKHKSAKVETEDNPVKTASKAKNSKTKNKRRDHLEGDSDSLDRKSKSMTDRGEEEEDENVEQFITVESNPITGQAITNIPTASIVTVTETYASLIGENIQVAKIEATTRSQSDETMTVSPQKIRQFTPRSRMNVKRANSSTNRYALFDFKVILVISFITLFIINI